MWTNYVWLEIEEGGSEVVGDKGLWVLNEDLEVIEATCLLDKEPQYMLGLKSEKVKVYTKLDAFQDLQDHCLETYKVKNAKYGDSFGMSIEKYGLISALTRMSDKWNRLETLILSKDDGTEDETLEDTLLDLANYCLMTIIELKEMAEK